MFLRVVKENWPSKLATLHRTRAACDEQKDPRNYERICPRFACADVTVSATWTEVPHIESQQEREHAFGHDTDSHQDCMPVR